VICVTGGLNKEYIIIEKDGIPIAGLMDIDEFEDYPEQQDAARRHVSVMRFVFRYGGTP
jgi:hypothetical protein